MNDNDVDGEIEAPAGNEPGDFEMHCDNKSASIKIVNGFAMTLADALCDCVGGNYAQTLLDLPANQDPGTALLELTGDVESRRGRRFGISVVFRDLAKPTLGELHRRERDRADALEAKLAEAQKEGAINALASLRDWNDYGDEEDGHNPRPSEEVDAELHRRLAALQGVSLDNKGQKS